MQPTSNGCSAPMRTARRRRSWLSCRPPSSSCSIASRAWTSPVPSVASDRPYARHLGQARAPCSCPEPNARDQRRCATSTSSTRCCTCSERSSGRCLATTAAWSCATGSRARTCSPTVAATKSWSMRRTWPSSTGHRNACAPGRATSAPCRIASKATARQRSCFCWCPTSRPPTPSFCSARLSSPCPRRWSHWSPPASTWPRSMACCAARSTPVNVTCTCPTTRTSERADSNSRRKQWRRNWLPARPRAARGMAC